MNQPTNPERNYTVDELKKMTIFQLFELSKTNPQAAMIRMQKIDGERVQGEQRNRLERIEALRQESNVPPRHWEAKIKREGRWAKTFNHIEARIGTGFMIALVGGRGCGKTQIGTELIRDQITKHLREAHYLTAMSFFLKLKETFADPKKTEKGLLDRLQAYPLLVIDEVSKRPDSEWATNIFNELIDNRYQHRKDTLLLANCDLAALGKCVGDSITDRINETGGCITCNWTTFRGVK